MSTVCLPLAILLLLLLRPVDWAAHLGGLIAGMLVGIPVFAPHIENVVCRFIWILVGIAATVVCFTYALVYMYSGAVEPAQELRDVCAYYQEFFEDYECVCQRN